MAGNVKPVPSGAWDTHHHIFEPDRFPFAEGRHFTPARASLEQLQKFEESIGVEHVCIAHGLSYGADCSSLLYYLGQFQGSARGICVLNLEKITDDELNRYHEMGIRSVRLDFFRFNAVHDVVAQVQLIERTGHRLAQWQQSNHSVSSPWSIQIQQPHLEFWPELRKAVARCLVPVVVDHFALIPASSLRANDCTTNIQDASYLEKNEQVGLAALRDALHDGNLWVKLSAPYRCSNRAESGYDDMRWLVRFFVEGNPKRMLWGSDWPHTQRHQDRKANGCMDEEHFLSIDDRGWIESMSRWMSVDEWEDMWVRNPATFYDYSFWKSH
ncbi:hypothetical protein ASPWEDRAFT_121611 [Aspergillus wentii DTO 134E9]|uniref:Amidohydrolase-related domain-containing protein n=1 Tax=Aspergillus wentii DTO 134E9 TaxID=1073089 RepID=A0A1L9R4J8_ASPWE|nr:uncharacterized protein ASPWEDRAFT_121611 [Aspergillus wentii DTO 134E9]KAI9927129.1 hypothetical protein MW887_003512 [Aspergillus wentii]OJJ29855.1 hypothetical protein ASPWEDRAFT_121611 [Aspergillus wentii DTO 134E9]